MKKIMSIVAALIATVLFFSCNKYENSVPEERINVPNSPLTKAAGDKTPSILCYIETNDVCHRDVMQAIATGRNWGTLYCEERNEPKPDPITGGYTITYAMATAN